MFQPTGSEMNLPVLNPGDNEATQPMALFPRRLHGQCGQRHPLVRLDEIIRRPFVRKQHDGIFAHVVGETAAGRQRQRVQIVFFHVHRQPADDRPGRRFESRHRAVFAFEPELHDLELQRTDGGEQRYLDDEWRR